MRKQKIIALVLATLIGIGGVLGNSPLLAMAQPEESKEYLVALEDMRDYSQVAAGMNVTEETAENEKLLKDVGVIVAELTDSEAAELQADGQAQVVEENICWKVTVKKWRQTHRR